MILRKSILSLLFAIFSLSVLSQNFESQKRPIFLGIKSHVTGMIIPHRDTLKEIASSTPRGIQFEISRFNISEKSWQSCNCYARTGFGFSIFDYGNRSQLGQSYNLTFFLEPYFNINKKIQFTYRAGIAFSYLNQTHDPISNPENLFYSSEISYMMMIALQANYELKNNLSLNVGAFYNHISNGGMKQPNLGMNFPTLSLGLDYILRPVNNELPVYKKVQEFNPDLRYFGRFSGSIKTVEAPDSSFSDTQKSVSGFEIGALKPLSKLNAILLGFEFISDGSWKLRNQRWGADFDHRTLNLLVGHGFMLGRFIFTQQMGVYLYKDFPNTSSPFYQRYGLYYQIGDYLNLGFSMKSHWEVAEIMDVRAGIMF